jgi:hypothetical protein
VADDVEEEQRVIVIVPLTAMPNAKASAAELLNANEEHPRRTRSGSD